MCQCAFWISYIKYYWAYCMTAVNELIGPYHCSFRTDKSAITFYPPWTKFWKNLWEKNRYTSLFFMWKLPWLLRHCVSLRFLLFKITTWTAQNAVSLTNCLRLKSPSYHTYMHSYIDKNVSSDYLAVLAVKDYKDETLLFACCYMPHDYEATPTGKPKRPLVITGIGRW